jgi:hypothetical protein
MWCALGAMRQAPAGPGLESRAGGESTGAASRSGFCRARMSGQARAAADAGAACDKAQSIRAWGAGAAAGVALAPQG